MSNIQQQLIVMGEPKALILDYLDSTDRPTIDGFYEYKRQEESAFNRQSAWDGLQAKNSISTMKPIDGSGIAGLMSHFK